MVITKKHIIRLSIIWLGLPVVLFLLGWVRLAISVPVTAALVSGIIKIWRNISLPSEPIMEIDRKFWLMAGMILLLTVVTGIGGFFYQNFDHIFRNAVFYDLSDRPWPVIDTSEDGSFRILCYYHGFWLPAAGMVKLTGSLLIGRIVQFVYAYVGIMTALLFVFGFIGRKHVRLIVVFVFLLFCGWDVVTDVVFNHDIPGRLSLPWYFIQNKDLASWWFSAPTIPVETLYIYNQGIAAWIALGLMWMQRRDLSTLVLIYSMMFIFAPIPSVGVFPAVLWWTVKHLKRSVTLYNFTGCLICLITGLYLRSNNNAGAVGLYTDIVDYSGTYITHLLIFILCSYVVFFPFIWSYIKHDRLFWILFVSSLCLGSFCLGDTCDFAWRVSIPFVCYLMVLVIKKVDSVDDWRKIKNVMLAIVLLIGAVSSSGMYAHNVWNEYTHLITGRPLIDRNLDSVFNKIENKHYNNFVGEGESFFSTYLMRRQGRQI